MSGGRRRFSPSRESYEFIFVVLFIGILTRVFLVAPFEVTSQAMAPQLLAGDYVLTSRVSYGLRVPFSSKKVGGRSPRRGELVVFKSPESPDLFYLNRVVGLPGDRVEMERNILSINGIVAEYTDLEQGGTRAEFSPKLEVLPWWSVEVLTPRLKEQSFGPVVVPPGHVFVLGDHRSRSYDSRYWGFVPLDHLEARPLWIWWSIEGPKSLKKVPKMRWERFFRGLL